MIDHRLGHAWGAENRPLPAGPFFFNDFLEGLGVQGDYPPGGVQGQSPGWGSGQSPVGRNDDQGPHGKQ
ncbi:hypothetical protein WCLP8_520002 [uncultured Gammaproteobacteria bacterium]